MCDSGWLQKRRVQQASEIETVCDNRGLQPRDERDQNLSVRVEDVYKGHEVAGDVDKVKLVGISHRRGQRTYQNSSARTDEVAEPIDDGRGERR